MGVKEELQKLNEAQRQVVENLNDNLLVMAPAGTGKTNVISLRVAHFVEQNVDPEQILCLTFTNKACQELQSRLTTILGVLGAKIWVKTFHSFCYQIIKEEAKTLGKVTSNLTIIDEEDAKAVIKELLGHENLLWDKVYQYIQDLKLFTLTVAEEEKEGLIKKFQQSSKAQKLYDSLKNTDVGAYTLAYLDRFNLAILQEYQRYLEQNHLVDFNDLIIYAYELMKDEVVLKRWQKKFTTVMVDEVQDTSFIEYQLIEKLATKLQFSAFGDFNQTIYEWRDSNPSLIYSLIIKTFKPTGIELTINYRSTQKLVQLGATYLDSAKQNRLINPKLSPKRIDSAVDELGTQPVFYEGETKEDEMLFITDHLKHHRLHELANTVILTRSNRQNVEVANFLRANQIPCYLVEQFSFFRRKGIKDILSLVKYLINPFDRLALERCLPIYFPTLKVGNMVTLPYKKRYEKYGMNLGDLFDPKSYTFHEPFGLLGNQLEAGRLVIFDVESTGLDVTKDEVIQIAAVELVAGKLGKSFERFILPINSVADSVHVHGFCDEYLQEVGEEANQVFTDFLKFIDGAILVGHNVLYDLTIVSSHMKRVGLNFDHHDRFYDTLDITRRLYPGLENYKLETLSRYIGTDWEPTHNAMDDILATQEILVKSMPLLLEQSEGRQNVIKYYRSLLEPIIKQLQAIKELFNTMLPHEFMKTLWEQVNLYERAPWCDNIKEQENLRDLLAYLETVSQRELTINRELPMWELWTRLLNQMSLSTSELDRLMKDQNQLAVITVHQAKGLEFDHVIIPFLNQGMFPLNFTGINPEEECRLFYVAITRAKKTLLLTRHQKEHAHSRKLKERSRFIDFLYS